MYIPLGISRALVREDIEQLRAIFGNFEFIDFNLARIGKQAFSLRIKRSRVPTHGGAMDIDETVGGFVDDTLRLTYGERVEFLGLLGSQINIRFTSFRK